MRAAVGLGALALAGCGDGISVQGTVDGQEVMGARDAFYDSVEFFGIDVTVVGIADFESSCEVFEGLLDNEETQCDERCEDYIALLEERPIPEDEAFSIILVANVGVGAVGSYDFANQALNEDTFDGSYSVYDTSPLATLEACIETCEDDGAFELLDTDTTDATGGSLEILSETTESLKGEFSLQLDGDALEGTFDATPCEISDWVPFL